MRWSKFITMALFFCFCEPSTCRCVEDPSVCHVSLLRIGGRIAAPLFNIRPDSERYLTGLAAETIDKKIVLGFTSYIANADQIIVGLKSYPKIQIGRYFWFGELLLERKSRDLKSLIVAANEMSLARVFARYSYQDLFGAAVQIENNVGELEKVLRRHVAVSLHPNFSAVRFNIGVPHLDPRFEGLHIDPHKELRHEIRNALNGYALLASLAKQHKFFRSAEKTESEADAILWFLKLLIRENIPSRRLFRRVHNSLIRVAHGGNLSLEQWQQLHRLLMGPVNRQLSRSGRTDIILLIP